MNRDFVLNNGVSIPGIAFGTWLLPEGADTVGF